MANTLTTFTPQILAMAQMVVRENAILPRVVNTSFGSEVAKRGQSITIPITATITAAAITAAAAVAANVDHTTTSKTLTLNQWYEAPFELSDKEAAEVGPNFVPAQLKAAARSLANNIDAYILALHSGIFSGVATPGTTPFASTIAVANSARKLLNDYKAPPNDRFVVLDPAAEANALGLSNILQFDQRGDQGGILNGVVGRKLGMDWFMDQNVATVTELTYGTACVTGWTSDGSAAAGVSSLAVINATATGALNAGSRFAIAGSTYIYVVTTGNATCVATTTYTIYFDPVLVSAVATAAALTLKAYVPNLVAHRECFAFASRPVSPDFTGGNLFESMVDPVSGVAMQLEVSRQYHQTRYTLSVLYGAVLAMPDLGCLIYG